MKYQPPYRITPSILHLVAEISESVGRLTATAQGRDILKLRKANRIRTIQGSLAIEGNTLSEAQITAIINGKAVIAPPKEIQEVRNALKAYEVMPSWQPSSEEDLLLVSLMILKDFEI